MKSTPIRERRPPKAGWLMSLALLTYALTVGSSLLPALSAPTLAACLASAGLAGAGTLLMAMILAGQSPYPRRAVMAAAIVLVLMVLLTPFTAGSPDAWRAHVRPLVWLAPWFPLATQATSAGRNARASAPPCSGPSRAATPLLIGEAVVLGAILLAVGPVSRLLAGHR